MMRLISWNVNRAGRRVEGQVDALIGREADVIALQEVSPTSVSVYWELMRADYPYFIDSLRRVTKRGKSIEGRPSGVVIASRCPLEIMETEYSVPTAEHKFLSVVARIDGKEIEVHTAHIPPGSQYGQRKIETFKGIYNALVQSSSRPRILCGDFNTPKEEMPDGCIVTWAQRKGKNDKWVIDPKRGKDWDEAERNIIKGLAGYDLDDVFRSLHGYSVCESSWYWKGKVKGETKTIGRRYDHIFASKLLKPKRCEYIHEFRDPMELSDHSPIEADFAGL